MLLGAVWPACSARSTLPHCYCTSLHVFCYKKSTNTISLNLGPKQASEGTQGSAVLRGHNALWVPEQPTWWQTKVIEHKLRSKIGSSLLLCQPVMWKTEHITVYYSQNIIYVTSCNIVILCQLSLMHFLAWMPIDAMHGKRSGQSSWQEDILKFVKIH